MDNLNKRMDHHEGLLGDHSNAIGRLQQGLEAVTPLKASHPSPTTPNKVVDATFQLNQVVDSSHSPSRFNYPGNRYAVSPQHFH